MSNFDDLIPIPSKDIMNPGLSSAQESTMLKVFGTPGTLTKDCSDPDATFKKMLVFGVNVGPFKVSGLRLAVESLTQVFAQIKVFNPDLFSQVKTAGVLCVRSRRGNASHFSNHSWGTAIDVFFGSGVVPQGSHQTHRGVFDMFPFFNKNGWYWGAEFSGDSVDSMHFEVAEETILKWQNEGFH